MSQSIVRIEGGRVEHRRRARGIHSTIFSKPPRFFLKYFEVVRIFYFSYYIEKDVLQGAWPVTFAPELDEDDELATTTKWGTELAR